MTPTATDGEQQVCISGSLFSRLMYVPRGCADTADAERDELPHSDHVLNEFGLVGGDKVLWPGNADGGSQFSFRIEDGSGDAAEAGTDFTGILCISSGSGQRQFFVQSFPVSDRVFRVGKELALTVEIFPVFVRGVGKDQFSGSGCVQRQCISNERNVIEIIHVVLNTEQNSFERIRGNRQSQRTVVTVCFKKVLLDQGLDERAVLMVGTSDLEQLAGHAVFAVFVLGHIFVVEHCA